MLDLDQTLIHSIFDINIPADVTISLTSSPQQQLRFNIRPYCINFLQQMSQYYKIYIFSASTKDYAEAIVEYLNLQCRYPVILGILHRKHCMQTMNGYRIKDLRIIQNRTLGDIVLVDNLVHCFGLQVDNGVPVLEFVDDKSDRELVGLEVRLKEISGVADVREWLRQGYGLKRVVEMWGQGEFLNVEGDRWREVRGSGGK